MSDPREGPKQLRVQMLDTHRTYLAVVHEGESLPYRRRLVTIELTEAQRRDLAPQYVGELKGKPVVEEIGQVWLEAE